MNTNSGITDGSLVINAFFDTCLFQAVSEPVVMNEFMCIPRCINNSNCLAVSVNTTDGCLVCLTNAALGISFNDLEVTVEVFVRLDQLERFIDGSFQNLTIC